MASWGQISNVIFYLLLLVVCVAALYLSIGQFRAQAHMLQAKAKYSNGDLLGALQLSERAVRLQPRNTELLRRLVGFSAARGNLITAAQLQRRNLMLQPANPYIWIEMAQILARQGRFGASFEQAVDNSLALGKAERRIQIAVAELGFNHWEQVSLHIQALAEENAERAVYRAHKAFLRRMFLGGHAERVCARFWELKWVKTACRSYGKWLQSQS